MKTGIIYKYTNTFNNKTYIGQTVHEQKRKVNHKSAAFNKNAQGYNCHFYRAIRKYGWESFSYEILENNVLVKDLDKLEMFYIVKHNSMHNGYNETAGGQGQQNRKHSEETKQKISQAKLGTPSPMKGIKLPAATKDKMKAKAKLRVGKNHNRYDPTIYIFKHKDTGKVVAHTKYEMSQIYNCSKSIYSVVNHTRTYAKGWYLLASKLTLNQD